jgi:hypothetical protein
MLALSNIQNRHIKVYLVKKSFLNNFALVSWLCGEKQIQRNEFYSSPFVLLRQWWEN